MEKILECEGILLLKNRNKYILQYDSGELMVKLKNLPITNAEAKLIINNPKLTYDIILNYQDNGVMGDDVK